MSENELERLYGLKGEAVTQIEIWQSKLQTINKGIIDVLNTQAEKPKEENKPDGT